jgi:hypothetical protein
MKILRQSAIALSGLLVSAAAAMGAPNDGFTPTEAHASGSWKNWLALVLFFVAMLLVAFKNARRTHLD